MFVVFLRLGQSTGNLFMMTFINWESLLKIKHAENLFSCISDPFPRLPIAFSARLTLLLLLKEHTRQNIKADHVCGC